MDIDLPGAKPANILRKLLPNGSFLHRQLHIASKGAIRKFINYLAETHYKEIYKMKLKEGWINPEVAILHDKIFGKLIEKESKAWTGKVKDGRPEDIAATAENDCLDGKLTPEHMEMGRNERLWLNLRIIACCLADEDSYYLLRIFFLANLFYASYSDLNIAWHRERPYWDWPAIRAKLLADDEIKAMREKGWVIPNEKEMVP
mgnify:CR=1 FL=1